MTEQPFRQAPHNLEAEQALLGAILVNNEAHDRVSGFLEAHHFYDPLHQQIYETLSKLIASGKRANPITLRTFFEKAEPIDATTTVPVYLGRLAVNATTIINAREYGHTIHDLHKRRALIQIGEDVANAAYDSPVDFSPKEQIEEAEARLYALAEHGKHGGGEISAAQMHAETLKAIEGAYNNKGVVGLSTGLTDLDDKAGRLQASDLIILAGRPGMGKTSLATAIMRIQTEPVHFFSAEMSSLQIGMRRTSEETGIPVTQLRTGKLDEGEWRRVFAATGALSQQRLEVDATGGISIGQLVARARRVKRQIGTGLIVVDYLQLMSGTKRRGDNRTVEVSEITTGLKALAKELNVPIIALSQLSRAAESRSGNRPQLSDLRESGSIEQDADIVLFIYREEYYLERERPSLNPPGPFADWTAKMALASGKAEVIIGKQRHGPLGVVQLQFDGACTRFSNLAHGSQVPNGVDVGRVQQSEWTR